MSTTTWAGVSVEDQKTADERIPVLLNTPASIRFIYAEPLLGRINLAPYLCQEKARCAQCGFTKPPATIIVVGATSFCPWCAAVCPIGPRLDWVIVGAESGREARPCDLAWIRSITAQCQAAGVPVFIKQLGKQPYDSVVAWKKVDRLYRPTAHHAQKLAGLTLKDGKGGDMAEWGKELRVREWPL